MPLNCCEGVTCALINCLMNEFLLSEILYIDLIALLIYDENVDVVVKFNHAAC